MNLLFSLKINMYDTYQSSLNFSNPSHHFTQGYFLQVKLSTLNDVHYILIKKLFDDYQLQKN